MNQFWCNILVVIVTATGISAENASQPLFLTPYIESGEIAEGRRLARVHFTDELRVKSYAGFFTVNKAYNSNMFLWYFPAMASDSKTAPVLLWLQGGPGDSSLYGLLAENGPIQIRNGKFERRKYHWALNHHIFYIDNPVGSGFSFTDSLKGYCTEETQVGQDLYSAVYQFFQLFPELQKNKFFITGESYAGKYVPALAYTIHKKNPTAKLKINLKGIAIGNGLCDPVNQMVHSKYLLQLGLLDHNQAQVFESYEKRVVELIKMKNWGKAYDVFNLLINGDPTTPPAVNETIFKKMTGFDFYYNYLHSRDYINLYDQLHEMLEKDHIRYDMHVGNLTFNIANIVANLMKTDWMKSITPWLSVLIDNYQVLIYNGQMDIIIAWPSVENYLRKLDFGASAEYKTAKRYIWRVDGEIAGYAKRAGNLVQVLVRDAGHMVPTDQPKWALDLITRFTEGRWNELGRLQRTNNSHICPFS